MSGDERWSNGELADIVDGFDEVRNEVSRLAGHLAYLSDRKQRGLSLSTEEFGDARALIAGVTERLDLLRTLVLGESSTRAPRGGANTPRVLVVDDDLLYTSSIVRRFRGEGILAFAENDPGRALGAVEMLQPTLVLVDICMPSTDGCRLAGEIKASRPEACVAVVSGRLTDQRLFAAGFGADYVVDKDLGFDVLRELAQGARPAKPVWTTATVGGMTDEQARKRHARTVHAASTSLNETARRLAVGWGTARRLTGGEPGE